MIYLFISTVLLIGFMFLIERKGINVKWYAACDSEIFRYIYTVFHLNFYFQYSNRKCIMLGMQLVCLGRWCIMQRCISNTNESSHSSCSTGQNFVPFYIAGYMRIFLLIFVGYWFEHDLIFLKETSFFVLSLYKTALLIY